MASNADQLRRIAAELSTLHAEYETKLQPAFIASLNQQKAVQKSEEFCEKQVKHFMHNIQPLRAELKKLKTSKSANPDEKALSELQTGLEELSTAVQLIKRNLPAPAGKYLYLILGSVRVSMPSKQKLLYKIEYENFKLAVTWALLLLSLVCLFRGAGTKWDPVLMFGLVWFYCTLTIRESILKANGSNISGWWRIYHFLATGLSGVIVLWADKPGFQNHLRTCFLAYTFVVLVAHQLQYRYQAGTLYRLQALGNNTNERGSPMEISVEGVRSTVAQTMFRDFFILMPFLYAVYVSLPISSHFPSINVASHPDSMEPLRSSPKSCHGRRNSRETSVRSGPADASEQFERRADINDDRKTAECAYWKMRSMVRAPYLIHGIPSAPTASAVANGLSHRRTYHE